MVAFHREKSDSAKKKKNDATFAIKTLSSFRASLRDTCYTGDDENRITRINVDPVCRGGCCGADGDGGRGIVMPLPVIAHLGLLTNLLTDISLAA